MNEALKLNYFWGLGVYFLKLAQQAVAIKGQAAAHAEGELLSKYFWVLGFSYPLITNLFHCPFIQLGDCSECPLFCCFFNIFIFLCWLSSPALNRLWNLCLLPCGGQVWAGGSLVCVICDLFFELLVKCEVSQAIGCLTFSFSGFLASSLEIFMRQRFKKKISQNPAALQTPNKTKPDLEMLRCR